MRWAFLLRGAALHQTQVPLQVPVLSRQLFPHMESRAESTRGPLTALWPWKQLAP